MIRDHWTFRTGNRGGVLLVFRERSPIAELVSDGEAVALAARLDAMQDQIDQMREEQNRRAAAALWMEARA